MISLGAPRENRRDPHSIIGERIRIDGLEGEIVELHGSRVGVRMYSGDFVAVSRDEVEQNRGDRYELPDYLTSPSYAPKAVFEAMGAEAAASLARTTALMEWARDNTIAPGLSEADRIELTIAGLRARNRTGRMPTVQRLLGIESREAEYRYAAVFKDFDPFRAIGQRKKKSVWRYPSVSDKWRQLVKDTAKAFVKRGLSRPSADLFLERVEELAEDEGIPSPSITVARRAANETLQSLGTFHLDVRTADGNASRDDREYGHVEATYPGEYVLLDSTVLDVHAKNPFGEHDDSVYAARDWHKVELTVAMDLFSRCIIGVWLSPLSTKGLDLAELFHEILRPVKQEWDDTNNVRLPGVGAPSVLLLDWEGATMPTVRPVTAVVDNGKVYDSYQMRHIAKLLGMDVQFGRKLKGSDKAHVERFFRTIRLRLLQRLHGYKGNRPAAHGKAAEANVRYPLQLLYRLVREDIATVYHRADHRGVHPYADPGTTWAPLQKLQAGLEDAGAPFTLSIRDLAIQLLPLEYRSVQHYGVQFGLRTYRGGDGIITRLNGRRSDIPGAGGLWPIYYNVARPELIFLRDPDTGKFAELWDHNATDWNSPFAIENVINQALVEAAEEPRTTRRQRDRSVGKATQKVIDRIDQEHGIETWKQALRRNTHSKERYRAEEREVIARTDGGDQRLATESESINWDDEELY